MRFLGKRADSPIRELRYRLRGKNTRLLAGLLKEQHNFCAYTEKRVDALWSQLLQAP